MDYNAVLSHLRVKFSSGKSVQCQVLKLLPLNALCTRVKVIILHA